MASTVNFYSASYDKIQSYIDSKVIGAFSYIICKDEVHKNELIFVDKELQMRPIVGYEQNNIIFVDELPTEQYRTNAFYVCNNIGYLYINDVPVPVFKELSEDITSYDQLNDLPLVNKRGTIASPIVLVDLEDGCYSITGQYKIGGNLTTIYAQSSNAIFIVESDEENKYITKLDGKQIVAYTISFETMTGTTNKYATEVWVQAQGYATETYVDEAIDALYKKIASEALVSITKVSQLENDAGYLTAENLEEISDEAIADLF